MYCPFLGLAAIIQLYPAKSYAQEPAPVAAAQLVKRLLAAICRQDRF